MLPCFAAASDGLYFWPDNYRGGKNWHVSGHQLHWNSTDRRGHPRAKHRVIIDFAADQRLERDGRIHSDNSA